MRLKRYWEFARRYLFLQPLPHGVVSWRYLLPNPPVKVRIHRQLWKSGKPARIPFILFFIIEAILWLRWVFFAGWRATFRVVWYRGSAVYKREGLSKVSQLKRVLTLSLGCCIRPSDIYAFGLYKSESKEDLWEYIFAQEQLSFHAWRNAKLKNSGESVALLQDKAGTSQLLAAKGIPMAPILEVITRGAVFDVSSWLQSCSRLFCKPCHGSRSQDAFIIEIDSKQGQAAIFSVRKGMKAQMAAEAQLRKAMMRDDFLIQPFLNNHPSFATLTTARDAITIRVITEKNQISGIRCYCATIEIPGDFDTTGHVVLPIDLASGGLNRFPERNFSEQTQSRYDAIYKRMDGFILPFWEALCRSAMEAHRHFGDICAIAWDYVVTPEGFYLLEGNSGWGAKTPQVLLGGFLQDFDLKDH